MASPKIKGPRRLYITSSSSSAPTLNLLSPPEAPGHAVPLCRPPTPSVVVPAFSRPHLVMPRPCMLQRRCRPRPTRACHADLLHPRLILARLMPTPCLHPRAVPYALRRLLPVSKSTLRQDLHRRPDPSTRAPRALSSILPRRPIVLVLTGPAIVILVQRMP
jgi:hypothetical protein